MVRCFPQYKLLLYKILIEYLLNTAIQQRKKDVFPPLRNKLTFIILSKRICVFSSIAWEDKSIRHIYLGHIYESCERKYLGL